MPKEKRKSKMKYIRTKNGKIIDRRITFKIPTEPPTIIEAVLDYEVTMTNPPTQPYIIVKEADTIEELCDRFVFEYKRYDENEKIIDRFWRDYFFMEVALETFNNCKIKDKVIYGAMITDKGLIYVAKMNEKGVLELI